MNCRRCKKELELGDIGRYCRRCYPDYLEMIRKFEGDSF